MIGLEDMMMRRIGVAAGGLAMTAALVLVGAGSASAAPVFKIKNGAEWTNEVNNGTCEVQTFSSNGTWTSDLYGDSGTWSVDGEIIHIKWTEGTEQGVAFKGTYTTTPTKEYPGKFVGSVRGDGYTGQLVKGVVSTWDGHNC
jgi:hypothetical protein